jgi:glycine cleavage system H protein
MDGDIATIGITDHAQTELGDITYLELPEVGETLTRSQPFGIVESVKAASDVYAPIDGEVVERNEDAIAAPEMVNSSAEDQAWLIKVKPADPDQTKSLMDPSDYVTFAESASSH